MRIVCIGGGPAGLYFALLMKKAEPEASITVYERNRPDDTFGWGVVFSDETLARFEDEDPESFAAIRANFRYWGDIVTHFGGTSVRSTGHGFSGLARKKLLQILQSRCSELGVELIFEREIASVEEVGPADLIVVADGLNSVIRDAHADVFKPSIDWRKCKFTWLGTDMTLDAFTFLFRENEHGLFQVHAYPFEDGRSTFIVECHQETWERTGLGVDDEAGTAAYFEELFADHLDGHRLLTNRSLWRTFPTVRCERWHHGNMVLVGDAAHTAHFSIGSGTKLAMEDAIVLRDAVCEASPNTPMEAVLEDYHERRWLDCLKTQRAAQTSLEWFENTGRYMRQDPLAFTFNLMTRSKRITYDNLQLRDPELVGRVRDEFARSQGVEADANGNYPVPIFTPYRVGGLELPNRVVVSPMCQYSAKDGTPNDWHLMHLGARATGGAGLLFTEMTNVSAEGRITHGCAGLWNAEHTAAWKRIVQFVHEHSATRIAIQLGHAGRKASCSLPWEGDEPLTDETRWAALGPSADPFDSHWPNPKAMDRGDMERVRDEYAAATRRAEEAGFDMVEVHMAHGYLLSSFISPAANKRTDEYGGSLENRMRYPLEVFDAVRAAFPAEKPVGVRISATDWLDGERGTTAEESVQIARWLQERGCALMDVSTAGNTPESKPNYGRMYQVPFAERIRYEVGMAVMAVGAIQGADHANTILAAGRADLCAMARPHLLTPHLTLQAAVEYGYDGQFWPNPYLAVKPKPASE